MSSLKSIKAFSAGNVTVRVYRDTEWEEYRCRLIVDGNLRPKADYHTDDKQDAIDTARSMCARAAGQHINTIL